MGQHPPHPPPPEAEAGTRHLLPQPKQLHNRRRRHHHHDHSRRRRQHREGSAVVVAPWTREEVTIPAPCLRGKHLLNRREARAFLRREQVMTLLFAGRDVEQRVRRRHEKLCRCPQVARPPKKFLPAPRKEASYAGNSCTRTGSCDETTNFSIFFFLPCSKFPDFHRTVLLFLPSRTRFLNSSLI